MNLALTTEVEDEYTINMNNMAGIETYQMSYWIMIPEQSRTPQWSPLEDAREIIVLESGK